MSMRSLPFPPASPAGSRLRGRGPASCIACLCLLLALSACGEGATQEPPRADADDVEEEAREAVEATRAYVARRRYDLTRRAEQRVEALKDDLAQARDRLGEVQDEARAALEQAIDRGDRAREELSEELDRMRQAGAEGWDETEERVSDALAELDEAQDEITAALYGDPQDGGEDAGAPPTS